VQPWLDLELAEATLALEDFPSFKLTRLATAVQQRLTRLYAEHYGVSTPEWRLLAALHTFSLMSVQDLLRLTGYDKGLISRTLTALQTKRIVRLTPDPKNAKRINAAITARGRTIYARILPEARRRQVRLLAALEPEERTALYSALTKLQAYVADDFPE